MSTIIEPYVPPGLTTTTTTEVFTTTTFAVVVTASGMTLECGAGKSIPIPAIGYKTNQAGKVKLSHILIAAVPDAADGIITLDGVPVTNGTQISPQNNGRLIFEASSTFNGTTINFRAVTSVGQSAVTSITINYVDTPSDCDCGGSSTTTTHPVTTSTTTGA